MFHLFKMTTIGKTLLAGGTSLFVACIALSNGGLLPLGVGDFFFFLSIAILAALYRPGWIFLLLVMALPLETVNLAPMSFGLDFRPYQFLELSLLLGLLIRLLSKRTLPELPEFGLPDALLLLVPIGSLFALVNAPSAGLSFKLSLVLLSLYGLYVLGRIYLQSLDDVRKALPFVLASGLLILSYAIFQNVRFLSGSDPFQVMPGRPDGGFPEPDWLGMYLVFFGVLLVSLGAAFRKDDGEAKWRRMAGHSALFFSFAMLFTVLLMAVSRSAWLGMFVSGVIATALFSYARKDMRAVGMYIGGISVAFFVAVGLVVSIPLTNFDLSGRAGSIASGNQEITVACYSADTVLPQVLHTPDELALNGCRHINLEEIDAERAAGKSIQKVFRSDPNVEIRKDIYAKSWSEIQEHPVFGIGWGSISRILGTDERGAGLNASNVFLEVWLGSGILGLVGLLGFFAVVVLRAARMFLGSDPEAGLPRGAFPIFVLSVVPGLVVFDLFNAGILLGFLWVLFAAILIHEGKPENR